MENNNQEMTIYVANNYIQEFNIMRGARFYIKDDRVYRMNGEKMPVYFTIGDNEYFTKTLYKFPCKIGDHIQYNIKGHPQTGIAVDIDELYITVRRDGTNGVCDKITHRQFKKCNNMYYFISSSGCIQKAVLGKNPIADKFRKETGNHFESHDKARQKLTELRGY